MGAALGVNVAKKTTTAQETKLESSCPLDPNNTWVINAPQEANFRSSPELGDNVIGTIERGSEVNHLETQGEWEKVQKTDCEVGFVSGNLIEPKINISKEYTEPVFDACAYQGTEIADMRLGSWEKNGSGSAWIIREGVSPSNKTPQEIIDTLYTWRGRNLWQGYESSDPSGLGGVRRPVATMSFTLGYNQKFDIFNDPIDIEFGLTADGEGYVMPQSSSKTFGSSDGKHVGNHHLCGIYAIPKEYIDTVVSWFTPVGS